MSAPLTNSPMHQMAEWRKRPNSNCNNYSDGLVKRARCNNYYYILASESSPSEDEGSESVDSIQGKETDYCRDTSDTDTKSEMSDYDISVEYEIMSSSESENPFADGSSSGEGAMIAVGAVAASLNDGDIDIWATDGDDETDSVSSIFEQQFNCQTCRMCKMRNSELGFPLCLHCYQIRKNCFPPRPRHKKKSKHGVANVQKLPPHTVTKDNLSACLNVLSQDSGMGSSQELQPMSWDKVVVPENLIQNSSKELDTTDPLPTTSTSSSSMDQSFESWKSAASEMCIMCNAMPKDGIFLHNTGGHLCCCYKCAVKYWTKSKRCAYCNLKVNNVVKAFLV